jgi:predicted transcriptional regulator
MFPRLEEIKLIRKKLDLTQNELAKKAEISQSLIAKIEAGKIDPTYTKAKKIFETLNTLSTKRKVKAKDIMKKNIISAKPREKISQVILDMRKHGISQLPVVEQEQLIGFISDSIILDAVIEGKKTYVDEIMDERPPSVSLDTDIDIISDLLRHFQMVAVFNKNVMIGIITKADILNNIK